MPAAVAVAAGLGGVGVAIGAIGVGTALVGVASAYYSDRQQKKAQKEFQQALAANQIQGITQMVKEPAGVKRVYYGENIRLSGNILFMHQSSTNKNILYMVIGLAPHALGENYEIYVNEESLGNASGSTDPTSTGWSQNSGHSRYGSGIFQWRYFGDAPGVACQALINETDGQWTSDHKLTGQAYLVVKMTWNQTAYPNGIPNIVIKTDGKMVYDPRTTNTDIVNNPALALLDYLRDDTYGLGFPDSEINMSSFSTAANVCEQTVDGSQRYNIHGGISTRATSETNINLIRDTFSGRLSYTNGTWKVYAGAYQTPTLTLDESHLQGSIGISAQNSIRDVFNTVRGVFVDAETGQPADYPEVSNASYVTDDNGEPLPFEFDLPLVNDPDQAQRLANIELERNRHEIIVNYPCNIEGLKLIPGDNVYIDNTRMGWSSKPFEVLDWIIVDRGEGVIGVDLTLKETGSTIYDDISTASYEQVPSTNLPKPNDVDAPSGLSVSEALFTQGDVLQNRVTFSWTPPNSAFIWGYDVKYVIDPGGAAEQEFFLGVFHNNSADIILEYVGDVDFYVRTRNTMGAVSSWQSSSETLLGKTAPPSDVSNLTVESDGASIVISWDAVSDLDLFEYIVRVKSSPATTWGDATEIGRVKTNFFRYLPGYGGTQYWMVKAIDTTGNESDTETVTSYTIQNPGIATNLEAETYGNIVILRWDEPTITTYNIKSYSIYRSTQAQSYSDAEYIGQTSSRNFVVREQAAGDFTYYLVTLDIRLASSASQASVDATTVEPTTYKAQSDNTEESPFSGTLSNMIEKDGALLANVADETFEEHFTNNSANSFQDLIDDGNTYILEPRPGSSYYEYVHDTGINIERGRITASLTTENNGQNIPLVLHTISVSADGVTYSDYNNVTRLASNFRYVKHRVSTTNLVGDELFEIEEISLDVDAEPKFDDGTATIDAADTSGTLISFNEVFADVQSITANPLQTSGFSSLSTIINFVDAPNPTSFRVLLLDKDDSLTSGTITWQARGF